MIKRQARGTESPDHQRRHHDARLLGVLRLAL